MDDFICEVCQTIQPKGDGFCRECGGALHPVRFCEGCGVPLPPNAAFCRECGTPAPPPEPAAPIATAPPPTRPAPTSPPPQPATTPSTARSAPVEPLTPAPIARPAPPRPLRQPTTALPDHPPAGGGAQLVGSAVTAGLGIALLAAGGAAATGGVVLLPVAVAISWRQWQYYSALLAGKTVDWIWDRPGLRRRLLDES